VEKLLRDEINRNKMSSPDLCIAGLSLLMSLSCRMRAHCVTNVKDLSSVYIPDTVDVFICYKALFDRRGVADYLVESFQQFNLTTVCAGQHVTDTVFFRWTDILQFWSVTGSSRRRTYRRMHQGLPRSCNWRICVYVRQRNLKAVNEELQMNLGGQQRMRCAIHLQFLVKHPNTCTLRCCVSRCTRTCRWICQAGRLQCPIGLCHCHGKDLVSRTFVTDVEMAMEGRLLRQTQPRATTVPFSTSDSESEHDVDERILAPLGTDDFCVLMMRRQFTHEKISCRFMTLIVESRVIFFGMTHTASCTGRTGIRASELMRYYSTLSLWATVPALVCFIRRHSYSHAYSVYEFCCRFNSVVYAECRCN
jgi:hypothetical protein